MLKANLWVVETDVYFSVVFCFFKLIWLDNKLTMTSQNKLFLERFKREMQMTPLPGISLRIS